MKLKPDNYSYPFSFQLAKDLPSSYEAQIGRVRYTLKAHIDIPWAFDKYTKRTITVVSALDLNTIPEAKVSIKFTLVLPYRVEGHLNLCVKQNRLLNSYHFKFLNSAYMELIAVHKKVKASFLHMSRFRAKVCSLFVRHNKAHLFHWFRP